MSAKNQSYITTASALEGELLLRHTQRDAGLRRDEEVTFVFVHSRDTFIRFTH